jgi:hypothetical protein
MIADNFDLLGGRRRLVMAPSPALDDWLAIMNTNSDYDFDVTFRVMYPEFNVFLELGAVF